MANGYVVVKAGGVWDAAIMQQGRADSISQERAERDAQYMPRFWGCYGTEFGKLQPGVYRFSRTVVEGRFGFTSVKVGQKVKDVPAEVVRLREKGNRGGRARTGMPGIQGYQHMENMSTASMEARQAGQRQMAEWLEEAAVPRVEDALAEALKRIAELEAENARLRAELGAAR